MAKWIEYLLKKKPADEDMLMLEDAETHNNKRVSFSGIADWLIEKMKKNNLISGALRFKGSSSYAALPGKGAAENDYYYCSDGDGTHGPGYYAWNESSWIWIGNNDKGIDKSLKVEGAAAEAAATGEAIASLKEDIEGLGGQYVGQKISFEDGVYINTSAGGITKHESFSLSNPIKVLSGTSVTINAYCNNALGVGLLDSTGKIQNTIQVTKEANFAVYSKTIDIPDWCSSIRISCVKSHKNDASYVVSSLFDYTQKRIDKTLEQINQSNKTTAQNTEEISQVKSDLVQLDGTYVGQKISFEDGVYINTSAGGITKHESFSLSNPIKVLSGTSVTINAYCNNALGVGLLDSTGKIQNTIQVTKEANFAVYSKTIDIPDWCSSIRISCVLSYKNLTSYSVSSLFDYMQQRINTVSEKANNIVLPTKRIGLTNPYEWGNASIQTQLGTKYTSNTRLCTINYWTNIESITCKDGYNVRVWCYKNDGTYIGGWDGSKIIKRDTNFSEVKTDKIYEAGADKLLIVVLKDDNSNIATSEVDNIIINFNSNNITDEIEDAIIKNKSISATSGNIEETIFRKIAKQGTIRGKYIFPKDIHSTNSDNKLITISSDVLNIDIGFEKKVTTVQDDVPQDPVPVYNAGIVIKANETEYARLSPDGWRKELFLGEDAISVRFAGDCNDIKNQDIRLKIDAKNITIYHKNGNNIASFAKANYETMKALYEAMSTAKEYEVIPLHLDTLVPDDIIECDVPLVGKYYTDSTNVDTFYDAYPFYCTTKQKGKEYDIELLFDIEATYPLQILINGYCIAKFPSTYAGINTLFGKALKITVYNNQNNEIICNSVITDITECKSLYPNIRILYCEKIEKGFNYQAGYSISENRIKGIASKMHEIGRKYITMKQIEDVLDGVIDTQYKYYWTFQLDDGSINCVTDEELRKVLLRDGIKPSIAMMPSVGITETEYKILKASESAGFEYHIHAPYTEPSISIPYLTYTQLDARVTETIEKFIEMYGSLPTVWGKHAGIYHYSTCRYLKNKGFRVIFGDNAESTSINEVTRYACKRTLIQEQSPTYDMLSTLKNVY